MPNLGTLVSAFSAIGLGSGIHDDDAIDRLNHFVMYGLYIALAIGSGVQQYVGHPIYCLIPIEYNHKQYRRYIHNLCWISPLYRFPFDEPIPLEVSDRMANDVSYYRWVMVFFLVLAFMFRVPRLIWRELKDYSGVSLDKVVGMTLDTVMMDQDQRDVQLGHVAHFLNRWIRTHDKRGSRQKNRFTAMKFRLTSIFLCYNKRSGYFLVLLYLIIKCLYLANVVTQFVFISKFLKLNFWSFGFEAMGSYFRDGTWEDHYSFPRLVLCDLDVRQLENINKFTVQCVLSINLFLEKIFLFLWFCLMILLITNIISLGKWAFQLLSEEKTRNFLMTYSGMLVPAHLTPAQDKAMFMDFARNYLGPDGVFLVRMIAANVNELVTIDLVKQMWLNYKFDDPKNDPLGRKARKVNGKASGIEVVTGAP